MASEYYKWLARNEKPREKRELTRQEKWENWWHYHKWHVVAAILAVLAVGYLIGTAVTNITNTPDYSIAYIGSKQLPQEQTEEISTAFAALGEDLNGDGQVRVQVNQYIIYSATENGEEDFYSSYAGKIQMMADFEDNTSFFFLLEDPARFQTDYGALAYPDGTVPQEGTVDEGLWIACSGCEALAGIDLEGLCLARRIFLEDVKHLAQWEALWLKMIG